MLHQLFTTSSFALYRRLSAVAHAVAHSASYEYVRTKYREDAAVCFVLVHSYEVLLREFVPGILHKYSSSTEWQQLSVSYSYRRDLFGRFLVHCVPGIIIRVRTWYLVLYIIPSHVLVDLLGSSDVFHPRQPCSLFPGHTAGHTCWTYLVHSD